MFLFVGLIVSDCNENNLEIQLTISPNNAKEDNSFVMYYHMIYFDQEVPFISLQKQLLLHFSL